MFPTAAYGTLGVSTFIAIIVSIQTLLSIQEQNIIESRSFLFDHALEIQKVFIENPDLYDYFYNNKEIPDSLDSDKKVKILVTAEMITDMLDNAAGSRIKDLSEGWSEYAIFLYENGPAFRDFYNENKDWYPKVELLINREEINHSPSLLDTIKDNIANL